MIMRSLRTTQVLVLLALVGASATAQAAAPEGEPPPDDGFAVEDESPPEGEDEGEVIVPSTEEPPPEGEDEGEVIMPTAQPEGGAKKEPPPPTDEGDWSFEVEDVSLVQSHLGPQGPRYDTLASWALG